MNKFFVEKEIYKERLDICRACPEYFKVTGNCKLCGCFMKVKASMAFMACPAGKWEKTDKLGHPKDIPKHLIKEVMILFPDIENKIAKDEETKTKAVELYNTIFNTKYKTGSNCSSCLHSIWQGLSNIYNKNK